MKLIRMIALLTAAAMAVVAYNELIEAPSSDENPGYMEQYMTMKANSNGVIPQGLRTQWNKQTMLMKSENGLLENIQEVKGPIRNSPTAISYGGRTRAILIDQRDPNRIWAGAVSGGLWRSNDGGTTWNPVNDYSSSLAVTCIAQNPFNPNEIIYGTGEGRGNSAGVPGDGHAGVPGEGVFISKDGGETFQHLETTEGNNFSFIWDVEYSKTEPNTFYIGTNAAGLFRALNSGDSIAKIYSTATRIYRVQTLPDSTFFFAREKHGVYRGHESAPGTVTRLTSGLPTSSIGRCNVSFCESQDSTVYLSLYHSNNEEVLGIYRSDDRGNSWSEIANPDNTTSLGMKFGWYCHLLEVSPVDPDHVILGFQYAVVSTDGGKNWRTLSNSHADYHIAAFYPNTRNALIGNDGGVYRYSYNSSIRSYSFQSLNDEYNVFQYYAGSFFPEGEDIIGGTQDNGTWGGDDDNAAFIKHNGGDGAYCEVDALGERLYYSSQNGNLGRKNLTSGAKLRLYNRLAATVGTRDFWFINPFTVNRIDGAQLYFPTKNHLARTTDAGNSFEAITNSLLGTAYSVAVSEDEDPTLYIGGSAGIIYYMNNASTGKAGDEERIDLFGPAQARGFVANIEINPNVDSEIFVGLSNVGVSSRIWKITDANSSSPTWESIGANLPENLPVNWIEVDPLNSDHIIIATDFGLYTTVNGGGWWEKVQGIPNVAIHMIKLRHSDRKLFIYTHGRGVWLADLSNSPTSVPVVSQERKLDIYPNPVTDFARIEEVHNGSFEVYDLNGKSVFEGRISGGKLDLRALQNGTYFTRVRSENGVEFAQKIVVSR